MYYIYIHNVLYMHVEGELRGEWIYVYVWLDPITVPLKLSQHC